MENTKCQSSPAASRIISSSSVGTCTLICSSFGRVATAVALLEQVHVGQCGVGDGGGDMVMHCAAAMFAESSQPFFWGGGGDLLRGV